MNPMVEIKLKFLKLKLIDNITLKLLSIKRTTKRERLNFGKQRSKIKL